MSMPEGLPQARPRGRYRSKTRGMVTIEYDQVDQKLISEQNFVTKLNHAPHLAWGLSYMSMHNRLPHPTGGAIGQSLEGCLL